MSEPVDQLRGLGDFVRETIDRWKVPGAAVAVVQGTEVVRAEGFGLGDVDRSAVVTARTLFPIASCTKAFTTASMAALVDDGRLDWDAPVRQYLPRFALKDPVVSERITPRDLVTHRSGLPRHDLLWYGRRFSREDLMERLRYLEPSTDFRSIWQYQNLMYTAAGYLVGHISGESWESFTRRRILDPLGMARTTLSISTLGDDPDAALGYVEREGEVRQAPYRNLDAICPAGGINSCVEEMSRWVVMHLNGGRFGDRQVVSSGQVAETHASHMVTAEVGKYPETPPLGAYGLGWHVRIYRGHVTVAHTGGIDGVASLVMLVPDARLGVVVLTNRSGTAVPHIVAWRVCDQVLGLEPAAWNNRFQSEADDAEEAEARKVQTSVATSSNATLPSHALDSYVGEYENPGYGIAAVTREGDSLRLQLDDLSFRLDHAHYDVFRTNDDLHVMNLGSDMPVTFLTSVDGGIERFAVPLEPTVGDVVFTRLADARMRDRTFLEPLVGVYELTGVQIAVTLKSERALMLSIPGQPAHELEPKRGSSFGFKGLTSFGVEFVRDAQGRVIEAIVTQPTGVFTATRR